MDRRSILAGIAASAVIPACARAQTDDFAGALSAAGDAQFIAIGERHDNPEHHKTQARLVAALQPSGLAFEMIPDVYEEEFNSLRRAGASREALAEAISWAESGWPDWSLYAPILEAAPDAYVACGGLSRDTLGAVYKAGAPGLGDEMTQRYALDQPLPEAVQADMLNTQYEAHCGLLERSRLGSMVSVQRAWDAAYAEAWRRAALRGAGRSVLICGNAHARLDQGAPRYLKTALPDASVFSIGQTETGDPVSDGGVFSFVLTAPRPERDDPCEKMRASMNRD